MRRTRDQLPTKAAPIHIEIDRYLREHARGWERAIPRAQLRAHLESWCQVSGNGGQWLPRFAKDFDREMRALAVECAYLGFPVLSYGRGYYSGRAGVWRDWMYARHDLLARIVKLGKRLKWYGFAREEEGRRERALLVGDPPKAWPPGHQLSLIDPKLYSAAPIAAGAAA